MDQNSSQIASSLASGMGIAGALVALLFFILMLFMNWKLVSKTGYSGWLSLLLYVPLVNFIVILILVFGTWPIERELQRLRAGGTAPSSGGTAVSPSPT